MFGSVYTIEEALKQFPELLQEKVKVVCTYDNKGEFRSVVLQFNGNGNYRTNRIKVEESK